MKKMTALLCVSMTVSCNVESEDSTKILTAQEYHNDNSIPKSECIALAQKEFSEMDLFEESFMCAEIQCYKSNKEVKLSGYGITHSSIEECQKKADKPEGIYVEISRVGDLYLREQCIKAHQKNKFLPSMQCARIECDLDGGEVTAQSARFGYDNKECKQIEQSNERGFMVTVSAEEKPGNIQPTINREKCLVAWKESPEIPKDARCAAFSCSLSEGKHVTSVSEFGFGPFQCLGLKGKTLFYAEVREGALKK